jgi:hypothetical protein
MLSHLEEPNLGDRLSIELHNIMTEWDLDKPEKILLNNRPVIQALGIAILL